MTDTISRPPPRQARAEEKRAKILRAAEKLLTESDPTEVTTKAVAKAAGVPIGSVYRYFTNADAMLRALFDAFNAETVKTMADMPLGSEDWRSDVERVFSVIRSMHDQHPAYGPLMTHLGRVDETDDSILLLLTDRIRHVRADLNRTHAEDIAAMVMGIVEAAERRFHYLGTDRRQNVFAQAEQATLAYLSLVLD